MNIGIDIMGGDYAPKAIIDGVLLSINELDSVNDRLILFGTEQTLEEHIALKRIIDSSNIRFIATQEVINMSDQPTKALTTKTNSSIFVGLKMLAGKEIDVFLSAGNTGAMVVGALTLIKSINGVLRPCIASPLPQMNGENSILMDVGAVPDAKPENILQFGILGSLYASRVQKKNKPRVALLNIGEEEEKGSMLYQNAYKILKNTTSFEFIGNIEGNDLFFNKADVILCDGYTGNIVLKEAEAFYKAFKSLGFESTFLERFNYENYGGTPLLGVNAPVVIGHGVSNANAIKNMILHSKNIVSSQLIETIKKSFEKSE